MIFCARETRGLRRMRRGAARCPSCAQNAHDRNVLAWDKSASRRARGWAGENVARSKGQPWPLPSREVKRTGGPSPGLMARPGKSIAKQSEGRAGEKYLPVGGRVRKLCAVGAQTGHPIKMDKRFAGYLAPPVSFANPESIVLDRANSSVLVRGRM